MRAVVVLALLLASPGAAQTYPPIVAPSSIVPVQAAAWRDAGGATRVASPDTPLPTAALGKQETLQLASANASAGPRSAFGGSYIFSQTCSGYGTLSFDVLGPDGSTWQTVTTRTAPETPGGTAFSLGSNATVRVTLSGTTGCFASLSRVPA